jgi:hypothetical protein
MSDYRTDAAGRSETVAPPQSPSYSQGDHRATDSGQDGGRLSLRLSPEARRTLEEISALRGGVSYAEVVRRALGTELYLIREQREGSRILIEAPDKTVRQIVLR